MRCIAVINISIIASHSMKKKETQSGCYKKSIQLTSTSPAFLFLSTATAVRQDGLLTSDFSIILYYKILYIVFYATKYTYENPIPKIQNPNKKNLPLLLFFFMLALLACTTEDIFCCMHFILYIYLL